MLAMTADAERALRLRLMRDFPYYAQAALRIRSKSGAIVPLTLNAAQRYLHGRLEAQKAETGMVRALILKGRQQGCSTYVGGRFYHRTTHGRGIRTFILTHGNDATQNLFEMVQRFHEHNLPELKPSVGTSNRKELIFSALDSGYRVGTAGSQDVGRSSTVQLFHGSEVAFWPNAEKHAAGVMQAIPSEPGTEIILESTANGMGNFYHRKWQQAERGEDAFQAIFVPWYWQDEYAAPVPEGFSPSDEEAEYQAAYGLTPEQMAWRREKVRELGDLLFKQEYPANPAEAFQVTGTNSFIKPELVLRARKATPGRSYGAVVAGFDPAQIEDAGDRDAFVYRQGLSLFGLEYHRMGFAEKLGFLTRKLEAGVPRIDMLFVDFGGGGHELASMLIERGFGGRVRVVNFGAAASEPQKYANRRAEMWDRCRAWLADDDAPASIPDDDALHADLVAPGFKYDSRTRLQLESKDDIRARGLSSPDGADAAVLTFAEPVYREHVVGSARNKAKTDYKVL
jgi:hypothetical protein